MEFSTDCCSWAGVTCNDCHVIGLGLSSESISSGIGNTSNLFDLQYLQRLNLANNSFNAAQIPSGLGKLVSPRLKLEKSSLRMLVRNLTKLTELYLDGTKISAQGDDWCQTISLSLPNLRVLSLSNCDLSGPLHPSLQMLRSLSVIQLSDNNLSGPIPEFIVNFSNLTSLRLRNCQFGTLPEKIIKVPTLQTLDLSDNGLLEGPLSEFPQKTSFHTLLLGYTNFSGKLPNSIGNLEGLSIPILGSCNFTGPIPNSLIIDLPFNQFEGQIAEFPNASSSSLAFLDMSSNKLEGLLYLNLSHNFLVEIQEPYEIPSLDVLDLHSNQLRGEIPAPLRYIFYVDYLSNRFSSSIPTNIGNFISPVYFISLLDNNLTRIIPESMCNATYLEVLDLSNNSFSGTIPRCLIERNARE
ncbi:hypothetical protein ACSBR1_035257 [Camellia fascicularis]